MKTRTIIEALQIAPEESKSPLIKAFDGVEDFAKTVTLMPSLQEVLDVSKAYDKKRNELIKEFGGKVKQENMERFLGKIDTILDTEIVLKNDFQFTEEEIKPLKLTTSELLVLSPFIKWGKTK